MLHFFVCVEQMVIIYSAILTGGIIWWQGKQLKKQIELQTFTDLYREWNDKDMVEARQNYKEGDLNAIEGVLEFLERIASYYERHVLSKKLLWDTFGWYIMRYYFYSKDEIPKIEKKWGDDKTLYKDLKALYEDLIKMEITSRGIDEEELKKQLRMQKKEFRESEKYDY